MSDSVAVSRPPVDLWFIMVEHRDGRIQRAGKPYRCEKLATEWRRFVEGYYAKSKRVFVEHFRAVFDGETLTEESAKLLDTRYNFDVKT